MANAGNLLQETHDLRSLWHARISKCRYLVCIIRELNPPIRMREPSSGLSD